MNLYNRLVQADTIPPTLHPKPLQPTSTGWHHTAHPLSWTSTTDLYRLTPYRPPFIMNLYNRLVQADTIPPTLHPKPLQPTSTGWHHTTHPLSWTSTTDFYRLTPYRPPVILNLYNRLLQAGTIPLAGAGSCFGCSETPPTAVCNIFVIFKPTDVNFPLPFKFHCRIQST